ncbi:MAG: hypothetical protein ROW39_01855 [Anaerolineaceae bacterium]|jgi:hypothetical protein
MSPQKHFGAKTSTGPNFDKESSRLLTAAVINRRFRQVLLNDPGRALSQGYGGEAFYLRSEEKANIARIQASSLEDFARQLTQIKDAPAVFAYAD